MPKELLPLGGKPVLGHALAEASRAGFESAVVVVSPSKGQIRDYLDSADLPLPVVTAEQPEPLGVGDAVLRCWDGEPIGVLLPDDVVLETDHWAALIAVHGKEGAATLCVRPVPLESVGRFGIVECVGERATALIEKPQVGATNSRLAVFGRYIVTQAVADGLSAGRQKGELELSHGFAAAIAHPPGVRAIHFQGVIYDCGTPSEYRRALDAFQP